MTETELILLDVILRVRDDLARYAQVQESTERAISAVVREHLRKNYDPSEYLTRHINHTTS